MLLERREEFISRWMESFQARLGPGEIPPKNVRDALPAFLDEMVSQLTEPLGELDASARRLSGPHEESDGRVSFGVEDACGGLPDDAIERIFDPFVQVAQDRSGHGLGLAIVKQAVDAHSGELEVRNQPGRGCEIVAIFPRGV